MSTIIGRPTAQSGLFFMASRLPNRFHPENTSPTNSITHMSWFGFSQPRRYQGCTGFCTEKSRGQGRSERILNRPGARGHSQRFGRFQILDDRAEVDGLWIKSLIFRDFGAVQNFEAVALEHLFAAPAFEGHDLSVNALFAAAIQVTEVRTHQGTRGRHFSRVGKKIDVKMWNPPRRGRHFARAVNQHPPDKTTRAGVIKKVASERFHEERNVLPE